MAVELHVFFRGKLPTKSALNTAMKELGFPISIKPARGSLEKQSGFMPMLLRRDEAGVEFDVFDGRESIEESGVEDVDPSYDRTASFRWGGDENEMLCGLCAAAALAKLANGVVFDEDNLMSTDAAIEMARKALGVLEKPKGKREPGTRPADIKRYLKPLLELRTDLVLIDRLLLIRPVRHVLRGVLLDRTSDKYSFRISRYVSPLYLGGQGLGFGNYLYGAWQVWQPHFQPLLFDVLAKDVFESLGELTTFENLAEEVIETTRLPKLHTTDDLQACVVLPVLAGRPELAAEFIREIERNDPYMRSWVKEHLDFLDRDIGAVCAEFHDEEAKTAKALQLGDLWEPSPFPAELPAEQRRQVAEPLFGPTPWISRPANLLAKAPECPGEVRFAKNNFERDGHVVLLVPLTREEAEERHRAREDYVLATRLAEGLLLILQRLPGWDRHEPIPSYADPNRWGPPPWSDIVLSLHSSLYVAIASFDEDRHGGPTHFRSINVRERAAYRNLWQCHLNFRDGERAVHDSRSGEKIYTNTPLTNLDIDLATSSMPAFGEFEDLVRRFRALLQSTGYGEFP